MMFPRRPLGLPITLGIVMIVLVVALTVGWVLLSVFGALSDAAWAPFYWALLAVGATFFAVMLAGVITYLALSIKAINLTRRQANFVDSVTHELKSPIASLKLYLQTLHRHPVPPEEQAHFFEFMLEDVERLDRLINHLLDAARLDKPIVEGEGVQEIELGELLRGCARACCLRYRISEDTVSFDLEPCLVRAAPNDVDMLFRNLIDNAIKYAGAEPKIEIALSLRPNGHARVRVADNGPGIPPKLRRKIFGRFIRIGDELQREKPGTGLGLYIVRTLVTRLKGKINVRGRDDGPGTVFEVLLPGASRPPEDDDAPIDQAAPVEST